MIEISDEDFGVIVRALECGVRATDIPTAIKAGYDAWAAIQKYLPEPDGTESYGHAR